MFKFSVYVLFLSICHCEEDDSLPLLLKFFHEKAKGNMGEFVAKYESEVKDMIKEGQREQKPKTDDVLKTSVRNGADELHNANDTKIFEKERPDEKRDQNGPKSANETHAIEATLPTILLKISLSDIKDEQIVIHIPINIRIENVAEENGHGNAKVSKEKFEMKPITRSMANDQDARDIALAKKFRDIIQKSRLNSQRRHLEDEYYFEEGVNVKM